ncbi:type II secretion system protein N [Polaromonas sp. YR568]|uniref:type II secretion system protein N n=1 Tax=Polaromonas sp. YR568 TaxID=1855301 RepID=UPI00398C0DC2
MTRTWKWPSSLSPARMAHVLGLAAVVAAACFWGYTLRPPKPAPPQVRAAPVVPQDPAARAVAGWLAPGQVRLNVAVVGLIRRHDRAVAVLRVNGAPPRPFMAGETLMRDVTLKSIAPDAVMLERAGTAIRIAAPLRRDYGSSGIVRVP